MKTEYSPERSDEKPSFECRKDMNSTPAALFTAWTDGFDKWFAIPQSIIMRPKVDTVYFFETEHECARHPHYGRFLELEQNSLISMTWLNAALQGAETVVTVQLEPNGSSGTKLHLTHSGFPNEKLRDQTGEAWPIVLADQDAAYI